MYQTRSIAMVPTAPATTPRAIERARLTRESVAQNSALDPADADALDEVALKREKHQHHRQPGHRGTRHQHAVIRVELALQRGQPYLNRVLEAVVEHYQRQDEAVPVPLESEDGQHRERRRAQRQNDVLIDLPFAGAVDSSGGFQLAWQRLNVLLHQKHAEHVSEEHTSE